MTYRVAQWATGMVGTRALRAAIRRPDIELVGVKVYDPAKVGRDAGELCGLDPVGIAAVADVDALLATRPDCVVHTPQALDPEAGREELELLLRSGVDVVTTAMSGAMHPPTLPTDVRAGLEQACADGDATLRASGLSPGFADELVAILMSGICSGIEHVWVGEYANLAHYESTITSDLLGWGKSPDYRLPDLFLARLDSAFVAPVRVLASCLGVDVDRVEITREHALATRTYAITTGTVPEGTIAAWRFRYDAMLGDDVVATIDTSWRTHDEWGTGDGWPVGEAWDVEIRADPVLRLHWEVGPEAGRESRSPHRMTAAAAHLVNSVPAVCAAPPGIMTLADLGNARGVWQPPGTNGGSAA